MYSLTVSAGATDVIVPVRLPASDVPHTEVSIGFLREREMYQAVEPVERLDVLGDHVDGGWTPVSGGLHYVCLPDGACVSGSRFVIVQVGHDGNSYETLLSLV